MSKTCNCSAKNRIQATDRFTGSMLPALEKRCQNIGTTDMEQTTPVQWIDTQTKSISFNTDPDPRESSRNRAGSAVLHAVGISMPGVERMNVHHRRRRPATGFSVEDQR